MPDSALKVLILEDNPYDAELNLKTLNKEDWVIVSKIATDESSFRTFLREFNPDIILSDYNLPVFNGIDALEIAKKETPLTPFIIVTGSLDEETAVNCIKQGAWDYVLKEHLIRLNPAVKYAIGLSEERKQRAIAESSLIESEEHYRALSESSPDVIMRFDRNHRHLFVNNSIVKQLGLQPEIFINKTHHEMGIFDPEMCDFWELHIEKVFQSKAPHEVEFSVPGPDRQVFFEWRLFPEFNQEGEVVTVLAAARDISFKKEAEKFLKENEERLQMALEATSDGLWDYNLKTNLIYFSPRYARMLGYDPAIFKNDIKGLYELTHPDEKDGLIEYINKSIKDKIATIEFVTRLRKSDGSYAWILVRGKVFTFDEEGKPLRIVGTNVDITLRKRQDDIQKTIFDIGNAVVTTRNLDELFEKIQEILGRIIDTKNCYVALYDKKSDTITLPFHRDEKDRFTEFPAGKTMTAYVIRKGIAQLVNYELLHKLLENGDIENIGSPSVSWLGVPLKIENVIFGVFAVQSYDESTVYTEDDVKILEFVSDQIAIAVSRKRDEDSIRENQQKLRRIIESSPDGLIVTGNTGLIIDHNTSVVELLRLKNKELKRRNFQDFVNPADKEKAENIFNQTVLSGYQKNIQIQMIREDDTEFNAEISLGLIQNSGDIDATFVIIIKDITERINYESNLRIAKERAEESDRLKTSFLSNMSHEIRTPLNAIVGFAELLAQSNLDEAERTEFISHINQGSDNLLNIIDDIIDISKIEAGQIRFNNSLFRLSSLFADLNTMFKKNLKKQNKDNLELLIDNCGYDPNINIIADSFRLKQIFTNLLSNALKFTEEGSLTFGIKSIGNSLIYLYVRDTGIGIKKENQELIFDRFRQGHESKTRFYGGTGLGLAISKHLIELMGGEISVISEPGKGSEFIFSIAYLNSDADIPVVNRPKKEGLPDWRNKTMLIVEDETSNYLLLHDVLKPTKVGVIWAKNGEEAVNEALNHKEINLVLMDIRLPLKNGYEATREIRGILTGVPVIALTAYAMAGEREKCLAAGCIDYISKPVKPKDLLNLLSRHLIP